MKNVHQVCHPCIWVLEIGLYVDVAVIFDWGLFRLSGRLQIQHVRINDSA